MFPVYIILVHSNRTIVLGSYTTSTRTRNIIITQPVMEQDIESIVDALRSRRINTLTELRRMERILVAAIQPHISDLRHSSLVGVLASAWLTYVQGNNLLSELRNLTRDYPFSSNLLDEAKGLVDVDPERNRSWNYAWLVLKKIMQE